MNKKIKESFENLVKTGIEGSIKKQDELFNSSVKNKSLFEKAKKLATY